MAVYAFYPKPSAENNSTANLFKPNHTERVHRVFLRFLAPKAMLSCIYLESQVAQDNGQLYPEVAQATAFQVSTFAT